MQLLAEDVTVSRRCVAGDTVCVESVTRNRDHHIDETLFHRRVEVERVPIGLPIDAVPPTREEGETTILSVVEEVIVIDRRFILKEEMFRVETVKDIFRRDEVEIEKVPGDSVSTGAVATSPTSPAPSQRT